MKGRKLLARRWPVGVVGRRALRARHGNASGSSWFALPCSGELLFSSRGGKAKEGKESYSKQGLVSYVRPTGGGCVAGCLVRDSCRLVGSRLWLLSLCVTVETDETAAGSACREREGPASGLLAAFSR